MSKRTQIIAMFAVSWVVLTGLAVMFYRQGHTDLMYIALGAVLIDTVGLPLLLSRAKKIDGTGAD